MPGQYYDSQSGLFYNWNRYYNPAIGRYVSSDPIGLKGGINPFLYAGANPLLFIDFMGLKEKPFNPEIDEPIPSKDIIKKGGGDVSNNCVSNALCEKQGWINDPWTILGSCYVPISRDTPNKVGDIITYGEGSIIHVAVVTSVDKDGNATSIRSKFGDVPGEYPHHPLDPELITGAGYDLDNIQYYRKKSGGCCVTIFTRNMWPVQCCTK